MGEGEELEANFSGKGRGGGGLRAYRNVGRLFLLSDWSLDSFLVHLGAMGLDCHKYLVCLQRCYIGAVRQVSRQAIDI